MPEELVPPVVAVVVANDPGRWFEECLEALGAQDYSNLDVLVVDAASHDELTARVAAVLPRAFILRQATWSGFSAAANEALFAVEGASHLLVCHDDVAPAPDAVRCMVGESYRSNAGIVGPKLVEWEAPDRLLQVGLGVDRFGATIERVEPGELDQAQHDEVREVFAVPGGCTLVRADLFRALGGFDPEIDLFGEDVDLCWRAQVAGARVVVAPGARVRHLGLARSGMRQVGDVATLRRRHELRAVLKNYDGPRRLLVAADLALGSVVEAALAFLRGDRERVRRVRDAWWWNWRHRKSGRTARKALARVRQQPDSAVVRLQSRGGRRAALEANHAAPPGPVAGDIGPVGPAVYALFGPEDEESEPIRTPRRTHVPLRASHTGWLMLVVAIVVVFGLRNLFTGHLPLAGQLLPMPAPSALLREFFSGWQDAGWQKTGPAPPAFFLFGVVGTILGASTAQAEKLLLLGSVAVGAVGMHRLLAPLGSKRARAAATIAYLGLPLAWNDIAGGNLQALVCFAGMPFVIARICRASRLEPFAAAPSGAFWRAFLAEAASFGLLLALMAALAPPTIVAVAGLAVAVALAATLFGGGRGALRALGVTAAAAVVAFACLLPWSLTFFQSGARWSILGGAVGSPSSAGGILKLLRFDAGPVGAGWLGWGILLAAALSLAVARERRLEWATRWWLAALATVVLAWAGSAGWLGAGGGATLVLLAPAAACIAAAVGLGVAAFETDVARSRYGWRQNLSAVAGLCLLAGLLPSLVSSVDGRSSLPSAGYDQILSWTGSGPSVPGHEVLFLGAPAAIAGVPWQIEPGLGFAIGLDGLPDGRRLWPSSDPGVGRQVETAVVEATSGETVRLGVQLAQAGVRYVIVPDAVAPTLPGVQSPPLASPPASLVQALQAQSDLRQLPTEGGVVAFENVDWPAPGAPRADSVAALPEAARQSAAGPRTAGLVAGLTVTALAVLEGVARRRRRRRRGLPTTSSGRDGAGPDEMPAQGTEPAAGVGA